MEDDALAWMRVHRRDWFVDDEDLPVARVALLTLVVEELERVWESFLNIANVEDDHSFPAFTSLMISRRSAAAMQSEQVLASPFSE